MNNNKFEHIAIIGYGLIGSSIGKSINKFFSKSNLYIYEPNKNYHEFIKKNFSNVNLVNNVSEIPTTVGLFIIASPLSSYENIFKQLEKTSNSESIITDVGSTKYLQDKIAKQCLKEKYIQYIPCHPISGTEKKGPQNAIENFLHHKTMIMCPTSKNAEDDERFKTLKLFWENLEANVSIIDIETHDKLLALTSHIPHLLAYLNSSLLYKNKHPKILEVIAGGYLDTTRISKSNPILWSDIFCQNPFIIEAVEELEHQLQDFKKLIKNNDTKELSKSLKPISDFRKDVELYFYGKE